MDNEPGIIKSLLDSDLYKFTMQQAVCKLFPKERVKYQFTNRGKTHFPEGFGLALRQQIAKMAYLQLTKEEKAFLGMRCGHFLDGVYLEYLSAYRFDPSEVGVTQNGGELNITIEGFWHKTILWEVPLMALISELYFKMTGEPINERGIREKNNCDKGKTFYSHNMKLTDFGTRRRYSFENQLEVCSDLKKCFGSENFFIGTSNVYIAMLLNIKPEGTHAHEWFMFMGARYGYKMANTMALEHWAQVYQGDLGIALSDTYTTDTFFKSFNKKFAKLYDGLRHDSGDPFKFIDKTVAKYVNLTIDPPSKIIVFSNALTTQLSVEIHDYCSKSGRNIRDGYGIGTHLSNDVGVKPLNIVIKMVAAQAIPDSDEWIPTVKLSDDEGKHTGSTREVQLCLDTLGIITNELQNA